MRLPFVCATLASGAAVLALAFGIGVAIDPPSGRRWA
jgi:hypothetical protein